MFCFIVQKFPISIFGMPFLLLFWWLLISMQFYVNETHFTAWQNSFFFGAIVSLFANMEVKTRANGSKNEKHILLHLP
jgi:hypothetical protein